MLKLIYRNLSENDYFNYCFYLVCQTEGYRPLPYADDHGIVTIGFGFNIAKSDMLKIVLSALEISVTNAQFNEILEATNINYDINPNIPPKEQQNERNKRVASDITKLMASLNLPDLKFADGSKGQAQVRDVFTQKFSSYDKAVDTWSQKNNPPCV